MSTTPQLLITTLVEGQASAETRVNEALLTLDAFAQSGVKSRSTAAAPGSPADGDRYLVPGSGTSGDFVGLENLFVVYTSGAWVSYAPVEGWRLWVDDENTFIVYDGASWLERAVGRVATGITASTTQTQGQQPLVAALNVVTVCANANDTVTLPAAYEGRACTVVNQGAQTCKVFPASGDAIDALGANNSTTIAAGSFKRFEATNTTNWYRTA